MEAPILFILMIGTLFLAIKCWEYDKKQKSIAKKDSDAFLKSEREYYSEQLGFEIEEGNAPIDLLIKLKQSLEKKETKQ
ncbi:hypothetical protein DRH14_05305 [Candidatus Shapirobacteria bacterium]|nr:MAG: hypothetical protein DRH14_05305 [Candidatus Shapirobacteria bacterium]